MNFIITKKKLKEKLEKHRKSDQKIEAGVASVLGDTLENKLEPEINNRDLELEREWFRAKREKESRENDHK